MNLHFQFVYYVPENRLQSMHSNVQRKTGAKLSCQVASVKYEFVEFLDRLNSFNVWHIFFGTWTFYNSKFSQTPQRDLKTPKVFYYYFFYVIYLQYLNL